MKQQLLTLTVVSSLWLLGSASAQTLQLKLDDGNGNIVVVTDNGSGDMNPTVGAITFAGAVGPNWYLNVEGATSKLASGSASAPELDLNTLNYSSGAGTLDVQLSDTGFTGAGSVNFLATVGGTTTGNVTFDTYADSGNALFASTTGLTSQDSLFAPSFNDTDTESVDPGGSPYSITLDVSINHPAAGSSGLDANLSGVSSPQPGLELIKTASPTNAAPGQAVTYSYAVTNTGNVTITNINIMDDNGTPSDTSDDFYVNATPFNLAPGQGTSFAINHISEPICMSNGGTNLNTGTLTVNVLANGNVEVFYNQSQALNDNRYGTNATAATGWSGGHKFSDLTGSDEATFLFTDGNGNPVLKFQEDYISSATSVKFGDGTTITYPSGYGTLGPLGGDGKMLIGASSNVLSCRTTLSDTINLSQFQTGYTVNSAPETSPLSNVSIPAGWNYTDGYYVLISSNAFGAAGFGGVTIPLIHNSPSKQQPDKVSATNVCDCVVNTAIATAYDANGALIAASQAAKATVCFPSTGGGGSSACNLTTGALKFDKNTIQLPIKNSGSSDVFMSELTLTWPYNVNGHLKEVDLNGKAWTGNAISPVDLTSFIAAGTKLAHAGPASQKNLVLKFEHNVDKTATNYSGGTVSFGTNSSCVITFLP